MTFLDQQIATLRDEITARVATFDEALTRLTTILRSAARSKRLGLWQP